MWGPSQFSSPITPNSLIASTATNGLGGCAQIDFAPGAGNPRYATGPESNGVPHNALDSN